MVNENIKNIISEHLLFKGFNKNEIEFLAKHSSIATYNEGDFLLTAREETKCFYLLISGTIGLQIFSHEHGIVELEFIQDGEFLGWSWLISPYISHYDAVATEKTKAIFFDSKALKKEMDNNHDFGYKMYKLFTPIIIERLQASRANILSLYEKKL